MSTASSAESAPGTHYDVLVVGSGFGGSVAALRLTEKGYKVGVLEAGARFEDKDFPVTSFDVSKYLFRPEVGCYGIQRIDALKDWHRQKPELFRKRPYNHTGCDR